MLETGCISITPWIMAPLIEACLAITLNQTTSEMLPTLLPCVLKEVLNGLISHCKGRWPDWLTAGMEQGFKWVEKGPLCWLDATGPVCLWMEFHEGASKFPGRQRLVVDLPCWLSVSSVQDPGSQLGKWQEIGKEANLDKWSYPVCGCTSLGITSIVKDYFSLFLSLF